MPTIDPGQTHLIHKSLSAKNLRLVEFRALDCKSLQDKDLRNTCVRPDDRPSRPWSCGAERTHGIPGVLGKLYWSFLGAKQSHFGPRGCGTKPLCPFVARAGRSGLMDRVGGIGGEPCLRNPTRQRGRPSAPDRPSCARDREGPRWRVGLRRGTPPWPPVGPNEEPRNHEFEACPPREARRGTNRTGHWAVRASFAVDLPGFETNRTAPWGRWASCDGGARRRGTNPRIAGNRLTERTHGTPGDLGKHWGPMAAARNEPKGPRKPAAGGGGGGLYRARGGRV
jgi:hypothetical protein